MPRVVLMCGPSGSGKSTYAGRLEREGMVRLSLDAELWGRGLTSATGEQRDEVEAALRDRLVALVVAGQDVVVDLSFWSRAMREEYRRLLAPTGVVPETVHLATDRETVLARVRKRRGAHAHDVVLDEATAARHYDDFEPPTDDEGPLTVVR